MTSDPTPHPSSERTQPPLTPEELRVARVRIERFVMAYEAGIDEIETKLRILQREFSLVHDYNPIEHISTRLKSMESLAAKAIRRGCSDLAAIREQVTDIAGVRVVCAFIDDVYRVSDILQQQEDIEVLAVKDYVATPKPNGYRSLHLVVRVPVFLSAEVQMVPVEVQFRTIAMDFWASLEHKIYYKYDGAIPQGLLEGLGSAACTSAQLDADMARLHDEVVELRGETAPTDVLTVEMLRIIAALGEQDA